MKNEAYARAAVDADDTRADAWYRLLDAAPCCNRAGARNKFILRFTHVSGMSWMLWAVLAISVADHAALHYPGVFAAIAPIQPASSTVTIPHSRISGVHGETFSYNAVVYCNPGLTDCIANHIDGKIVKFHPSCDTNQMCSVKVEFQEMSQSDMYALLILSGMCVVSLMAMFLITPISDFIVVKTRAQSYGLTDSDYFFQRMLSAQRQILFLKATGYNRTYPWKSNHASYADDTTMATFTPEDGFRLRLLWGGAPELPVWRFREVAKPPSPPRIRREWSKAMKMRDTVGVCMDVDGVIGVGWRADGGMRVWIHGRAYDSYVETPGDAPASVPE